MPFDFWDVFWTSYSEKQLNTNFVQLYKTNKVVPYMEICHFKNQKGKESPDRATPCDSD